MGGKFIRWTQEETDIVYNNCNEEYEYIQSLLPHRSVKSIKHKIANLDMPRNKVYERYNKEEDDILKVHFNDGEELLLKLLPSRTWESIRKRIDFLKLPRNKGWSYWSKDEEKILRDSENMEEITIKLPNRTESQIKSKLDKMKISFCDIFWTDEEVEYIQDNYHNISAKEISLKLNRTLSSVYGKANNLGLESSYGKLPISELEIIEMYNNEFMSIKDIANELEVFPDRISKIIPLEVRRHIVNFDVTPIIVRYLNGESCIKISKDYSITDVTVKNILVENEIEIRPSSHYYQSYIKNIPILEIKDLYLYGFSLNDLGMLYNVSPTTIGNRLREHNTVLRPKINNNTKSKEYVRSSRNNKEYSKWRKLVLKRDIYTCQCCNAVGVSLNVHHIVGYSDDESLRHSVENGITMCSLCHLPNYEGSFHNTYGTHLNTIYQLQEYFDDIRGHLNLPLVSIKEIVYNQINTEIKELQLN